MADEESSRLILPSRLEPVTRTVEVGGLKVQVLTDPTAGVHVPQYYNAATFAMLIRIQQAIIREIDQLRDAKESAAKRPVAKEVPQDETTGVNAFFGTCPDLPEIDEIE